MMDEFHFFMCICLCIKYKKFFFLNIVIFSNCDILICLILNIHTAQN